jgi:hypothetical protein
LEAGVPASDPIIQGIAKIAREYAIGQASTYQLAIDIFFLDKLGEDIDTTLIQSMGARLLAGQTRTGGWTYGVPMPDQAERDRLTKALNGATLKGTNKLPDGKPSSKSLDPAVEDILKSGRFVRNPLMLNNTDDNSNTQFAFIALWSARKHGLPVERALKAVETRFRGTQIVSGNQGGWFYSNSAVNFRQVTPSMTCVGLLGLAVVSGMKGEARMKGGTIENGVFKPSKGDKGKALLNPLEDEKVRLGLNYLGATMASHRGRPAKRAGGGFGPMGGGPGFPGAAGAGGGAGAAPGLPGNAGAGAGGAPRLPGSAGGVGGGGGGQPGGAFGSGDPRDDLYFMWCLERVGMVFNINKIGRTDWHEWGSSYLLESQNDDGSWTGRSAHPSGGPLCDTAFGLMFMIRSNIVRDLSKVLKATADLENMKRSETRPDVEKNNATSASSEWSGLTKSLLQAGASKKIELIKEYTDGKGANYTMALAEAIPQLPEDAQKQARDALADRMARQSAKILRAYLAYEDPELRSAACFGVYMSDQKELVPELIKALEDPEPIVWGAAKACLKAMAKKDFGPKPGDALDKRKEAAAQWREWWKSQ